MNKIFYNSLFLFLFVIAHNLSAQEKNLKVPLDGTWLSKTDLYHEGEEQFWFKEKMETIDWESMPVPGNWDLKNQYSDFVGVAWYRRDFFVPEEWKIKGIRLNFDAVYNDTKIWINGEEIGEHQIGFLPFWFDIDPYLKFGEDNVIVVKTDNTFKRGAIWNWGGIRRPVWLEITDKIRLTHQYITTLPDLIEGTANLTSEFEILNRLDIDASVGYQIKISFNDEVVWQSDKKLINEVIVVPSDSSRKVQINLTLPRQKVNLWHFDRPNLYQCKINLYRDGKIIHELADRFGIRKIEVDGYDFKLNGEVIRTVGFNWVPEDRTTGSTLPLWRIKQDIDMMKELGVNMSRLSHLPLPKAALDYLDEKGIMVFEEVSLWGKDDMVDPEHPLPRYWLKKMIQVKYNHPSIIGWCVGNEIGYLRDNPKVMEYVETAINNAKKLDPTRLAVYVSHSVHQQEDDPVKYSDIIMYNAYSDWSEKVEKVNQMHPGKPIFMAEFGDLLNDEDPNTAEIAGERMLNNFRGKEYILGNSLWTFNDYRSFWKSIPTWTTPPSQNRTWGIVNVFRQKKRPFFAFKNQHAPVQKLEVNISPGKAEIQIMPRDKLDIPAHILRDYKIIWYLFDEEGKIVKGEIEDLPVINPGDPLIKKNISWNSINNFHGLTIDLIDPQSYSRRDTTIYFNAPGAPEILKINTSANQARIVFKHIPNATEYKIRYGKNEIDKETIPTINDFMDVTDLDQFEEYQFSVIAINNAGESQPSAIKKATTDENELPPVIWKTIPFYDHFFIGFSVDKTDYLFEVQYGPQPGEYEKQIGLRNVGVVQIPGLKTGETYYYRLRSRKQWGFASEWTHELKVNLLNENKLIPIEPKGVLSTNKGWLIKFDPVDKAIGFKILYKEPKNKNWQVVLINKAVADYILLKDLNKNRNFEFKVEAIVDLNEYHNVSLNNY